MKNLWTVVFIFLLPSLSFCQKAFEAVHYIGKVQDLRVRFKLADGYLPASEINVKSTKSGKAILFIPESGMPDELENLSFYKKLPGGSKREYFVISGLREVFAGDAPALFKASYYKNGGRFDFQFRKIQNTEAP